MQYLIYMHGHSWMFPCTIKGTLVSNMYCMLQNIINTYVCLYINEDTTIAPDRRMYVYIHVALNSSASLIV